jgi:hypothetical protein
MARRKYGWCLINPLNWPMNEKASSSFNAFQLLRTEQPQMTAVQQSQRPVKNRLTFYATLPQLKVANPGALVLPLHAALPSLYLHMKTIV